MICQQVNVRCNYSSPKGR
uniref:Uncharacterized protein n=1 Tax=Anguilla anguilla TaxID=7936 RepID=A0A0E9V9U9_ANGAN